MDEKTERIIRPYSKKISISNRLCRTCNADCNRAFVIRFRGVLQLEFQMCVNCLAKARDSILAGNDFLIQFDTQDRTQGVIHGARFQ